MTMKCELTGKTFQTGNNVSHAKNRTKRRFLPNLQKVTFLSEKLGQKIQLKVAASTIRTVEKKGGLDDFLVSTPNSKLPEKAKKLKRSSSLINERILYHKRRLDLIQESQIFLKEIITNLLHLIILI